MNNLTLLLLVAHLLGDFYFQSDKVSKRKIEKYRYILLHCVLYVIPFLLLLAFSINIRLIICLGIIVASHFLVDTIKFLLQKAKVNSAILFVVDQILHISIIFVISQLIFGTTIKLPVLRNVQIIISSIKLSGYQVFRLVFLLLLVGKPVSVAFQNIFTRYRPDSNEEEEKRTGAIVGVMERLLIVIMLILNQYAAIGLILTGKSVARYQKMNEKDFAEYYLLGTLFSMLSAIVCFLLVWR